MKKRVLSVLLSLCLCLTLLPTAALAASTPPDFSDGWTALTTSTTTLSGGATESEMQYYYLSDNITFTDTLTITGKVTLDLNGKTLTGPTSASAISVFSDNSTGTYGDLTLMDSRGSGKVVGGNDSTIYVSANSELTLESGTVSATGSGTAITVGADVSRAIFTMRGGTVSADTSGTAINLQSGYSSAEMNADGGTVNGKVTNGGVIKRNNGVTTSTVFYEAVENGTGDGPGTILGGIFYGNVTNGYKDASVEMGGKISGGTFYGTVTNRKGDTSFTDPNKLVTFATDTPGSLVNNGVVVFESGYSFIGGSFTNYISTYGPTGTGYVEVQTATTTGEGMSAITTKTSTYYSNSGTTLRIPDLGTGDILDLSSAADTNNLNTEGYSWDSSSKTLTLKNILIPGTLTLPTDATIAVDGSAQVKHIQGNGALTIQKAEGAASGTLTVSGGIEGSGDLTIDGVTVNASGGTNRMAYGIYTSGRVTIRNGANVTVSSGAKTGQSSRAGGGTVTTGLRAGGGLTVTGEGTKLTATGNDVGPNPYVESYGIYVPTGTVEISDGAQVKATGGSATVNNSDRKQNAYSYGLYASGGLTVSGASTQLTAQSGVTETNASGGDANKAGGGSGAFSIGLYVGGAMNVTNGTVQANGGAATSTGAAGGAYSYGVYANGVNVSVSGGALTANSGSATANQDNYSEAYSIGILSKDVAITGGKVQSNGNEPTCGAGAAQTGYGGAYSYGVYADTLSVREADGRFKADESGNGAAIYVKESGALTLGETMEVKIPVGGTVGTATVSVEGQDQTYHTVVTGGVAARNVSFQVKTPEPMPSGSSSDHDSDPTYSITIAPTEHGSIPLRRKYAEKGETVTLPVTPDTGYTLETLTVTDKNGKELEVTARSDGQYTFKMPACGVTVTATFMEDNALLNFFVDVTADQYYYDAVLWAAKNGITGGVDDTHFAPSNTCTRAQLAAFLYRCAQARGEGFTGAWMFRLPFTDVPEWCYEAVAWCYMNGVVQGYSDETFAPDRTVTRQQAVAMLYRFAQAMGLDVSVGEDTNILSYNDAFSVSEYAVEAFQWAVGAGIVQGSNGDLNPTAPCTRAQIVTMLYRLLGR